MPLFGLNYTLFSNSDIRVYMNLPKLPRRSVNGVLLLNKPLGISSNQALQQVKRLFRAEKAGHTGALDPLASGLLPVCFGAATKFSHYLLDADKRYRTSIILGQQTATGDREGEIVHSSDIPPLNAAQIEQVLQRFRGTGSQIPPMYSALKQQGKTLYQLARQGIEVERAARPIHISDLHLIDFTQDTLTLDVTCSKGTYIRVLGEDIAKALGSCGHLGSLHRTATGHFELDEQLTLEYLAQLDESERDALLLPLYAPVAHLPRLQLATERVRYFCQGQDSTVDYAAMDPVLVFHEEHCLGLGRVTEQARLVPIRVLNT